MIDPFEQLIEQLSLSLDIPLYVDPNRACLLSVHNRLRVQIQLDRTQEKVILASFLAPLPPGRFRENVLAEGLKTNHLEEARPGVLGYHAGKDSLTLHKIYPLALLSGDKLASLLGAFIDYAQLWQEAMRQGRTSPEPVLSTMKVPSPFDLK